MRCPHHCAFVRERSVSHTPTVCRAVAVNCVGGVGGANRSRELPLKGTLMVFSQLPQVPRPTVVSPETQQRTPYGRGKPVAIRHSAPTITKRSMRSSDDSSSPAALRSCFSTTICAPSRPRDMEGRVEGCGRPEEGGRMRSSSCYDREADSRGRDERRAVCRDRVGPARETWT